MFPQVPTTMGASRKLNKEGPMRIPANNWNEMDGRPNRLLSRAASLEIRITDIKKMVSWVNASMLLRTNSELCRGGPPRPPKEGAHSGAPYWQIRAKALSYGSFDVRARGGAHLFLQTEVPFPNGVNGRVDT